jgi:hypothetical protein
MSNYTFSVQKFSSVSNVTGRAMLPRGYTGCGPTPENAREGPRRDPRICSCLNAAWLMTLRLAPLSISTWCSRMLAMTGAVMSGNIPAPVMLSGQSDAPKEMVVHLHRWCGAAFGTPRVADRTSRRRDLRFLREVSSQLSSYMTYSFLRRSLSPPESEPSVKTSFKTPSGDWYPRSRSLAATSPLLALSLPGR